MDGAWNVFMELRIWMIGTIRTRICWVIIADKTMMMMMIKWIAIKHTGVPSN